MQPENFIEDDNMGVGWNGGEGIGPSRSYNYLEVVRLAHTNSQAFIAEIVV